MHDPALLRRPRPSVGTAALVFAVFSVALNTTPAAAGDGSDAGVVEHDVLVQLDVTAGTLAVIDRITLPTAPPGPIEGVLHAGLSPTAEGAAVSTTAATHGTAVPADILTLTPEGGAATFTLRYGGVIAHTPKGSPHEHQRSFQETPGVISKDGVYLSPSSLWLLRISPEERVRARVRVEGLPPSWSAVSEGRRVEGEGAVIFEPVAPQSGAHLVAGPWTATARDIDGVAVTVRLREPDPALAARYLDVTGQYLRMYTQLIGPYPYPSFDVVENFWETGYGMPGFTLLGPKVIRFPFILHSSYPHELLHNWFGNGVLLHEDGRGENWCEGLTAYLADHLVQEQRGRAEEHRARLLSRYRDFVTSDDDFALRGFSGRSSPATEAVGYGKWAMVVHMIRKDIGDARFAEVLRTFYAAHKHQRAGFDDFRAALEKVTGNSWERFFAAWLDRTSAPRVRWSDVMATRSPQGKWSVQVRLEQTQEAPSWPMRVPFAVTLDDGTAAYGAVRFGGDVPREVAVASLDVTARPLQIDIDPHFDTFRRLETGELPPALSVALGAERQVFALPSQGSAKEIEAWRGFAQKVCGKGERCRVVADTDLSGLPDDASVWVLGYGNLLRATAAVGASKHSARFDDYVLQVGGARVDNGQHSIMLATRHPTDEEQAVVFVGAHDVPPIAGLARKLPHYGKYGYLAFTGAEPTNVLKGQWSPVDSPMRAAVRPGVELSPALERSEPLASLPPPFEADRMQRMVAQLSANDLAGRGYGSPGLAKATGLVGQALAKLGLKGPGGSAIRRCWSDPKGPAGTPVEACNLIAEIPGRNPSLPAVVLSAHLDGLGTGWPRAGAGAAGQVHPGANDNASGVAVVLEVARALIARGAGERPVWLAFFTGEESGLRGARHFVEGLGPNPAAKVMGVVNLDTVGRRAADSPFVILGGGSAREWVHIFMGVGFTTGVESQLGAEDIASSDQVAFTEKGIPGVQIFGGATDHFHTPTDTADRVQGEALVDAAVLTREAVQYLADRKEPLTAGAPSAKQKLGLSDRPVLFGTVPAYKHKGDGVLVHDVGAGTPAEKAGLMKGDLIVEFNGWKLKSLRQMSGQLRRLKPGDKVKVVYMRAGARKETEATLVER